MMIHVLIKQLKFTQKGRAVPVFIIIYYKNIKHAWTTFQV